MQFPNSKRIYEHDALIWLGDLNYRLSTPLAFDEIVRVCDNGEHRSLFYLDQVCLVTAANKLTHLPIVASRAAESANRIFWLS